MAKAEPKMTVEDVCGELRISRKTFYEWKVKGKAPHMTKLPNGEWRIERSDFDSWYKGLSEAA
ncbi:transcriptional regulator, AlpA family [Lentzea xinjiangensis]|uniref:Transcriptional regulator, AlpA family n=1 Tax=Lentzea xinjiangensis TaxID=402600 RepID=A0A1H9WW14_9PSEU|nr:helix-turn-helix domain-containing protein [Lentzea xinjiangensis]SES38118.1 transcriptional regulator, AlpA family [Lentzea xinjiangensis]